MPFPSQVTTQNYETLRGTTDVNPSYAASMYALFCPNVVAFKAQVNGAPTGTSFATITFDNVTVGAYTDIVDGMTVLIGSDADIRNATFVGRARRNGSGIVATSTVLCINETSESILDNANIWALKDYRVWDRLARQLGPTQLKDYDISFTTPAPIIYGLQSAYAGVASGTPEVYTLSFAPSALPITSGATINGSTWVWTVPSGMAITVGSSTTQNITAEFDAGFADWVSVQVNDSNGKTGVFRFFVGIAASDLSNTVNLNIVPGGIQGDENGWTCSVEAFDGIDTMLDNTLIVLFDVEYYNGTQTSILANVKMVGRIRKETDNTVSDALYSQLKKATLDIEGTLAQQSRVEHLPFTLLNVATPTRFDEVKNLTLWRAIAYTLYWHSTYLTLHSLTFDSTDNTFLYLGIPTQGGNILSVVQDIAVSNNATIESAPQGETRVYRNGVYLSGAQRAALVTVANFDTRDLINIDNLDITEVDTTGKIQGSGGFYNSTSGKVTPLLSLAPGVAQGVGEGITTFARQVLQANVTQAVAQAELNTRTGHEFAAKRAEGTFLTVTMPPGYNWLVPTRSQWYTWTLAATDTTGGRAFTTAERWQLFSVSYSQDNGAGTKSPVQATFKLETSGTAGQTVVYPPQTAIAPIIPVVPTAPPFPTFPPPAEITMPPDPTQDDTPPYIGDVAVSNGNVVWTWTAAGLWNALDLWLTNTPGWVEITPDALTLTDFKPLRLGSRGAYAILNDGVDSVFGYTTDAIGAGTEWVFTDVSGVYQKIRVGSTAGVLYLYNPGTPGGGCSTLTYNITSDAMTGWGSSIALTYVPLSTWRNASNWNDPSATASYTRTGGTSGAWYSNGYGGAHQGFVGGFDLGDNCVVDTITFTTDSAMSQASRSVQFYLFDEFGTQVGFYFQGAVGGGVVINSNSFNVIARYVIIGMYAENPITGTDLEITFSDTTPAVTVYSDDFGETFGSPELVGSSPGTFGGIDTQKIGVIALAGANGQVMKATSGGAWAAYGDPLPTGGQPSCIVIPRYKSSGSSNSGSDPDYIVVSNTLTASNESVWYVDGAGTVFTDITDTIGGEFGLATSPDCLDASYKKATRYSAVLLFDADVKWITSTSAGVSWSNRGTIAADASYIRYRPSDPTGNQLFIANGSDGIIISPSHGSNSIATKAVPSTDAIIGLEPF